LNDKNHTISFPKSANYNAVRRSRGFDTQATQPKRWVLHAFGLAQEATDAFPILGTGAAYCNVPFIQR